MIPQLKVNYLFNKGKKPFNENKGQLYTIHSGEKLSLRPGERKLVKTFLEIEAPEGYYCQVVSIKDLYVKNGLYIYPEVILPSKKIELQLTAVNINIPKSPYMMTDNERFLGEKSKIDIYAGDRIANILLVKSIIFDVI